MFRDRLDAGQQLARELERFRHTPGVILAVPRGGIPLGYVVAKATGLPLDLLMTKKIGHPLNREYAIGAVGMTDTYILPHKGISSVYIEEETAKLRKLMKSMRHRFMGASKPLALKGLFVIVIDDGAATGNTLLSAIQIIREEGPAKVIVAIPVASTSAARKLSMVADELVCPLISDDFGGVGEYYEDFHQVSDQEAIFYLDKLRSARRSLTRK